MNEQLIKDYRFLIAQYSTVATKDFKNRYLQLKKPNKPVKARLNSVDIIFLIILMGITSLIVLKTSEYTPYLHRAKTHGFIPEDFAVAAFIYRVLLLSLLAGLPTLINFIIFKKYILITNIISQWFITMGIYTWKMMPFKSSIDPIEVIAPLIIGYALLVIRSVFLIRRRNNNANIEINTSSDTTESPELLTQYVDLLEKYNLVEKFILSFTKGDAIFFKSCVNVLDENYQYPLISLCPDAQYAENKLQAFLSSEHIQQMLDTKTTEEKDFLIKCLNTKDNVFLLTNEERELYLIFLEEILKDFPEPVCLDPLSYEYENKIPLDFWAQDSSYITVSVPSLIESFYKVIEPAPDVTELYINYKDIVQQYRTDVTGTFLGAKGERIVMKELDFFSDRMRVLPNIRLELNGQSAESDIILVSPYGIFVLEVKNLGSSGSYNIKIEKDGLWKRTLKNGSSENMKSISRQNQRHLHAIEEIINTRLNRSLDNWIQAHSIIVIANDVVEIQNESDNTIIRASEILSKIRSYPITLFENDIAQIADTLLEQNLPPQKFEIQNWLQTLLLSRITLNKYKEDLVSSLTPFFDVIALYNEAFPDYTPAFPYNKNDIRFNIISPEK